MSSNNNQDQDSYIYPVTNYTYRGRYNRKYELTRGGSQSTPNNYHSNSNRNNNDKYCNSCGNTTRELQRLLLTIHNGNPKECCLRGPLFNKNTKLQ